MARFGSRFVQGVALLLIAAAVPIILWRPGPRTGEGPNDQIGSGGLPISHRFDARDDQITYRFLWCDEPGAIEDRLTLGRFVGHDLQEGATWDFVDTDHWHSRASELLDRERGWVVENQPGWQISGWLRVDDSVECDRDHLFWAIQALRFLDPESLANEIDMLEASGRTVRIYATYGRSGYSYEEDTLFWDPTSVVRVPDDAHLNWKWFQTDPLIVLAHELSHAWHDLCRNGDAADDEDRERLAIATENRIRHILFRKHSKYSHLYPRPGHQDTWPDLPGQSPQEAWRNYHGVVKY